MKIRLSEFRVLVKEFNNLVKMGYNPFKLIILIISDEHWRAAVRSGNGDLYIEGVNLIGGL